MAFSSVKQRAGDALRSARNVPTARGAPPRPVGALVRHQRGSCLQRFGGLLPGTARLQDLGTGEARPGEAERGSVLSFPHEVPASGALRLPPGSLSSVCTPSGKPGSLVPGKPDQQAESKYCGQPTLRDTCALRFILEPERTSFLAGLPR